LAVAAARLLKLLEELRIALLLEDGVLVTVSAMALLAFGLAVVTARVGVADISTGAERSGYAVQGRL
jgi:hypothetical protein